jgi:hypothetical protein
VVSAHPDNVERLLAGSITREMINPSARSRDRHAGPNNADRPSWRAIAITAATCPWGSARVVVNSEPAATNLWPLSVASIAAIVSAGSIDRFATVSVRTLAPSRNERRRYTDS